MKNKKKNPALFCLADTMTKKELIEFQAREELEKEKSEKLTRDLNNAIAIFAQYTTLI